jgi:hypothetical protein
LANTVADKRLLLCLILARRPRSHSQGFKGLFASRCCFFLLPWFCPYFELISWERS